MKLRNLVYWSNVWSGRRRKYWIRNYAQNMWKYRKYATNIMYLNDELLLWLISKEKWLFPLCTFWNWSFIITSISICHCNSRFIICQGNISMCQHMSPWSDIQYAEWYLLLTLSFSFSTLFMIHEFQKWPNDNLWH